jgi:hypothetical protein
MKFTKWEQAATLIANHHSRFIDPTDMKLFADGLCSGQLGQSVAWFAGRYPASACVPIMIHPELGLGQGASLVPGMRIIG